MSQSIGTITGTSGFGKAEKSICGASNPARYSHQVMSGFGRAVSRILSSFRLAPEWRESFVSAADTRNPPAFAGMERAAPGFPIWPCTRWGFPCRVTCVSRGGLLPHLFTFSHSVAGAGSLFSVALSVGTTRAVAARVYPDRTSPGYAASRPMVFGLSSPDLRQERFSTLPKPRPI